MKKSDGPSREAVRETLKVLLYHLARTSEKPSTELKDLLEEVIQELHHEVSESLQKPKHLRVVRPPGNPM